MTNPALTIGAALLAFGPLIALFSLIVYKKAQLVIVVTSSAFFFLLSSVAASIAWSAFDAIGLKGPLAAIVPGVLSQFMFRCAFVALYHKVEAVIRGSLEKQHQAELEQRQGEQDSTDPGTDRTVPRQSNSNNNNSSRPKETDTWTDAAKLRLELNDAACGVASGVGFGGMHAVLLYGTLLASETTNNVGVLYQDSCPLVPSLVVSGLYAFFFSVLDIFWMLFTFFGMRRRLMYHRGEYAQDEVLSVGGWLGNSRMGGNYSLLLSLVTHFVASVFTSADYFKGGCVVSIPAVGMIVLATAYMFWAGAGRIYMPPTRPLGGSAALRPTHGFHNE